MEVKDVYEQWRSKRNRNAQELAEISFKAGIKEVVEFLNDEFAYFLDDEFKTLAKIIIDDSGYYGYEGSIKKWQAKLKEWDI